MKTEAMVLRPEVREFAEAMERKLREHDAEKGPGVRGLSRPYCFERLQGEMAELTAACEDYDSAVGGAGGFCSPHRIQEEAVDVANFAMMLYLS